ncbi:MAG: hypothetical protein RLZZ598_27, partial [Pseudomonadota bacterium]
MSIRNNLIKARSYIVFLAGLACAFGAVMWIEFRSGWAVSGAAPTVSATVDRVPMRTARPLSEQERQWARVAWTYFERNVDASTGLPGSVENFPSGTMWDIGSYLLALISA